MSALSKLLPLVILVMLLGFFAFVGYAIYSVANDVADKTAKKMEQRHLSISKDGMVVGIREKKTERYVDQTQSFLVKAWNFSTWPAYKSRLWNKEQEQHTPQARVPYSRSSSVAGKAKA